MLVSDFTDFRYKPSCESVIFTDLGRKQVSVAPADSIKCIPTIVCLAAMGLHVNIFHGRWLLPIAGFGGSPT